MASVKLSRHLWAATFRDIERIVGGILPKAATTEAWWRAYPGGPVLPQHLAFADARFVAEPHIRSETVRFVRAEAARSDQEEVLQDGH